MRLQTGPLLILQILCYNCLILSQYSVLREFQVKLQKGGNFRWHTPLEMVVLDRMSPIFHIKVFLQQFNLISERTKVNKIIECGLIIFIFLIPFMRSPNLPIVKQKIQISDIVFGFIFLLWVFVLISKRKKPIRTPIDIPFILLVAAAFASFMNTRNYVTSLVEVLGIIYLYLLFLLVVNLIENKQQMQQIMAIFVVAGTLVAIIGLLALGGFVLFRWQTSLLHPSLIPLINVPWPRILSILKHPNGLLTYLWVCITIAFALLLTEQNKHNQAWLTISILIMTLGTVAAISRGVFIVWGGIYFFLRNLDHNSKMVKLIQGLSALFALGFFFLFVIKTGWNVSPIKIEKIQSQKELKITVNCAQGNYVSMWQAALKMMGDYPLLGVGLGMFNEHVRDLRYFNWKELEDPHSPFSKSQLKALRHNDPHNTYLGWGAELGVPGGLIIIIIFAIIIAKLKYTLKFAKDPFLKTSGYCFIVGLSFLFVYAITINILTMRYVWFLMGLSISTYNLAKLEKCGGNMNAN